MNELLSFLTDDWKKIPQNYRLLIIAGAFLIFNSWLLDHWGSDTPYKYLGFDIRLIGYNIGLSLILIAFFFISVRQFYYFGKVFWLRRKYPIKELNLKFYLIWFNGKLILFDKKTKPKTYHHVYPLETARDLSFDGLGIYLDNLTFGKALGEGTSIEVVLGEMITPMDFKEGAPIYTRG